MLPISGCGAAAYAVSQANATPPALTEAAPAALSTDLAGNLRVVQTSTQTVAGTTTANQGTPSTMPNAWPVVLSAGSASIGTSTVSAIGVSNVSIINAVPLASGTASVGTTFANLFQVGGSLVTLGQQIGANSIPVVMPTNIASAVSIVGTSNVSVIGAVPLAAGAQPASVGTVTLGVASAVGSLATIQLAATNVTGSIGTVTLPIGSNSLGTVGLGPTIVTSSLGTFQLGATNVAASIGTVTLGAAPGSTSLGTFTNGPGAASIGTVFVAGLQASGAAVAGNPVLSGGRAATTLPTAVTDGQVVARQLDQYGRTVVEVAPQALWGQGRATLTTITANAILAAAGANTKWAIRTICASSTQTATSTRLDIFDGSTAALIHSLWFPAGIGNQDGGPDFIQLDPPWVASINTQVLVQLSVAVTDVRVLVTAFKVL